MKILQSLSHFSQKRCLQTSQHAVSFQKDLLFHFESQEPQLPVKKAADSLGYHACWLITYGPYRHRTPWICCVAVKGWEGKCQNSLHIDVLIYTFKIFVTTFGMSYDDSGTIRKMKSSWLAFRLSWINCSVLKPRRFRHAAPPQDEGAELRQRKAQAQARLCDLLCSFREHHVGAFQYSWKLELFTESLPLSLRLKFCSLWWLSRDFTEIFDLCVRCRKKCQWQYLLVFWVPARQRCWIMY